MRILLVEDEERLAAALKEGLEKQGFAVDVLHDGDTASQRIQMYRNEYDIFILDLMMPGKDGATLCKELRDEKITTPVLILTARGEVEQKVDLLSLGADDYMVKPFSFAELVARLQALTRRPQEVLPTVLHHRDIELNVNERTVTKAGKPIELTLKEFVVLEYFMRHPGQVLTRETLLDHLWDFEFTGFSNIVDVHVKNLRNKLDPGRREGILETVRGVGYRLA